jgi:hypothetical protein
LWGDLPRPELCSAESIAEELPRAHTHIKRILSMPEQGPSTYEQVREMQRTWRSLAELFGLEYGLDVEERAPA